MKTLLLYDYVSGAARQLARAMSSKFGEHGSVQAIPFTQAWGLDVVNADILVIGGPTQHRSISPVLKEWLEQLPHGALDGMPTAVFDTRYLHIQSSHDLAAERLAQALQRMGVTLLVPPASFFVVDREGTLAKGELARAVEWARVVILNAQAIVSLAQL